MIGTFQQILKCDWNPFYVLEHLPEEPITTNEDIATEKTEEQQPITVEKTLTQSNGAQKSDGLKREKKSFSTVKNRIIFSTIVEWLFAGDEGEIQLLNLQNLKPAPISFSSKKIYSEYKFSSPEVRKLARAENWEWIFCFEFSSLSKGNFSCHTWARGVGSWS